MSGGGVNITSIKTASDGLWQGDNPLDFAFPLLIVQTILILVVTHVLTLLLKPFRQPKVMSEIVSGILLGPSATGRSKVYLDRVFPPWSTPILESVASIGLLFFLFLIGLELDLSSIRRGGRRAFSIAFAGIFITFIAGIGVTFIFRQTIVVDNVGYGQFLVFIGVALSITAFPVLARILAELKLLTTSVGEIAMAAAAFNDIAAWILLALAIALAGKGGGTYNNNPLVCLWVLLSGVGFVILMMVVTRPIMEWVARRCSCENHAAIEMYIFLTLVGVLIFGFITDLIGIHSIFGGFIFGLIIPKGGRFAERLIERIEDFVSGLLLPLYFASSGLKTDIATIKGGKAWGLLVLVITTACAGKILATFAMAMAFLMPMREALALGLLMNTKGLVELIVLNIGKEKKVLNDEEFAILVLMALFTTFITTPTVMAVYKPARGISTRTHRKLCDFSADTADGSKIDELRILACVHGSGNIPSLINLIELTRSTKRSSMKLFVMHLMELTERSSSIIMVRRARRNGFPFSKRIRKGEWQGQLVGAFQAYSQLGRVRVRPTATISSLSTMHEDICHVAEDKRVAMIILPFHKSWKGGDGGCEEAVAAVEDMGHEWSVVNQRVLENAPCSVAILVDRGFRAHNRAHSSEPIVAVAQQICIIFIGGPDDREALELGRRMAEHPVVKVTVVRFQPVEGKTAILQPMSSECDNSNLVTTLIDWEKEKEQDDIAVAEFRSKWGGTVEYIEVAKDIVEGVETIGRDGGYNLIVVGKGRFPSTMVAELTDHHTELGLIGNILAGPNRGIVSSVLVIQQHQVDAPAEETPVA